MRWSRKSRGKDEPPPTGAGLVAEVVKSKPRGPARPPAAVQAEWREQQALRDLCSPDQTAVEFEFDGGEPGSQPAYVQAEVEIGMRDEIGRSVGAWRMAWDGRVITFGSAATSVGEWRARSGGVLPEHREGPARGIRSELGTDEVAEIAAVANSGYVFWLLFLNERGRRLASHQVIGFDEARLTGFADAAGIHYRRYRLEVDVPNLVFVRMGDYFPARGTVLSMSETGHVVRRADWIRDVTRTQSDG